MKINHTFLIICNFFLFINFTVNANCDKIEKDTLCIVELKEFYDGRGIIFSKDDYFLKNNEGEKQVNLTRLDVIESEVILDSITNLKFKNDSMKLNEVKAKRRKYNRQYWGIESESGDKIVQLYIFNFSNPESIKYFEDSYWYKGLFISTGPYYAENARIYWINLTKRKLEDGSWPLELEYKKSCEE
jgi:hypothetical protein